MVTGDYTIYIEQVNTKADSPAHRDEMTVDVLENIKVGEAMVPAEKIVTVSPNETLVEIMKKIESADHLGYPVVENGKLIGIITFEDVEKVPFEERAKVKVKDVMPKRLIVTYPDETLEDVLRKLIENNIGRLPVVDRNDKTKLLGIITRSDVMKAHARVSCKIG